MFFPTLNLFNLFRDRFIKVGKLFYLFFISIFFHHIFIIIKRKIEKIEEYLKSLKK